MTDKQDYQEDDVWLQVLERLKKVVGKNSFSMWIAPLKFSRIENQTGYFMAPTRFIGKWVSQNFDDQIRQSFLAEGITLERLQFLPERQAEKKHQAEDHEKQAEDYKKSEKPAAKPLVGAETISSAPLDPRFTFDQFVVGAPNQLAFAAARRIADNDIPDFNPLFIYGGVGLGKTHLMQAIACEMRARKPQSRVFYLSSELFMYRFVQSLRDRSTIEFKNFLRSVDALLIDDIQFIAGKKSTQNEFIHTFNALVDQGKQVVISATCLPSDIGGLDERICSRLQAGLAVDLQPTDYDLRLGILRQKLEYNSYRHVNITMDEGVLEYLGHRICSSIRVLEGALTRLFAYASLLKSSITMELVEECLADILRASERKITIEEIMRRVAEHYNICQSDMLSPRRTRNIARPRQIAMYLAKNLTTRSYPEIGRRFGGRDHTTVLHAVRTIENLKESDKKIADDVQFLGRILRH